MRLYLLDPKLAKGKRPKQPLNQPAAKVMTAPAGGKMPLGNPSPTSAGIANSAGAASRGGKVVGLRADGRMIYETEAKDRSGRGAASGLLGATQKEFAKRHPKLFLRVSKAADFSGAIQKSVPVGTIHEWQDGSYKKVDEGVWVPVTMPGHNDHPVDQTGEPIGGPVEIPDAKPTSHPWRTQFSKYGITSGFPPADMHPDEVQVDLSGDIHSHWILRHRSPKTGHIVNAYSKEFNKRNINQKWRRVSRVSRARYQSLQRGFQKTIREGLRAKKVTKEHEAATILQTMSETGSRIGTKDSSKALGISTLRVENVEVDGDTIHFYFPGKYGIINTPSVKDRTLAKMYQKLIKGKDGNAKVFDQANHFFARRYLKEHAEGRMIPHDFRSWLCSKWAADEFDKLTPPSIPRDLRKAKRLANKLILQVATTVAQRMFNRPSNTRDSYINPKIINAWLTKHGFPDSLKKAKDGRSTFDIALEMPIEPHRPIPEKNEIESYPLPDWVKVPEGLYKGQLEEGQKEEMEHTSDPKKAKKIAQDHLEEDPKYYIKLRAAGLMDKGVAASTGGTAVPISDIAGAAKKYLAGRRPLNMSELRHTLKHGHYSIISAGRNSNHPEEKNLPADHPRFQQRHEDLRRDLDRHGFGYTEVDGHYGGKERSFIVHHNSGFKLNNPAYMVHHRDVSEHKIIRDLGKKYNQDSVIHSKDGTHEMHYTTGPNSGTHHKGTGHAMKPHASDSYTEVPSLGRSSRFSLNFDWDHYHGLQHALYKSVELFVRALTTTEVKEEAKRKLRFGGVAAPMTPDLPEVGQDWEDAAPSEEAAVDEEGEEIENEGSFSNPFSRVEAKRRIRRSLDLFVRA